jgi:hypothetical protein
MGAMPFQETKWARLGKRLMSPPSPRMRAALDGPTPLRLSRPIPGLIEQSLEFGVDGLHSPIQCGQFDDELGGELARRVLPTMSRGPDGGEQGVGLGGGEELLGSAGDEFEQQPTGLRC